MRVAVFSDIHGNYQALDAILKDIKTKKIDMTFFLGDAIGLGPDSTLCLKLLNESDVIQVLGNHEYYCINDIKNDPYVNEKNILHQKYIDKLNVLPNIKTNNLKCDIDLFYKKFSFFHFFLSSGIYPFLSLDILKDARYKEILSEIPCDYAFFGHEHKECYYEVNGKKFYGVGSSGCVKGSYTYYYLIDISLDTVKVNRIKVKFDRKKFINSINNKSYPTKDEIANKFFGIQKYKLKKK